MLKFILLTCILIIVIVAGIYIGAQQGLFSVPSFMWTIVVFLSTTSFFIFMLLFRVGKSVSFTQFYLLSVVSKICIYGIFVVIIIFLDRKGAPGNVALFMISYMCFTSIEVALLFKKINS